MVAIPLIRFNEEFPHGTIVEFASGDCRVAQTSGRMA
jgi:hypothetical protein